MKLVAFILAICWLAGATVSFWVFFLSEQEHPAAFFTSTVLLGLYCIFKEIVVWDESSNSERGIP